MASATVSTFPLPSLPAGWEAEKDFKAIGRISDSTLRTIEPVGPHFLAHARRARHKRTFSEDDRIQAQESTKNVEDDEISDISEPEDPLMFQRDAKDWKNQDHYQVLGISKFRYKATEEQIKRAHRKKVLVHHPDKKAAAGRTDDDNFFKCIQKATEVLLDPVRRRQFDSVDEAAEVEPPTKKQLAKGGNAFYKLWGNVFKAEGRFSKNHPVPTFGDDNSTKEHVEEFYNFWYNFDSWRTFEYLDEDVPDDNENRDQKRHMERKNANARKKKKAEDDARLRKLLDDCSAADERIKRFRREANAAKNKKRLDKEEAERKAKEDAQRKKEDAAKAAKAAEEAAKADREAAKKAKEAAKNAVKKNKRVLKGSVKEANYFAEGEASAATIDAVLDDVDLVQGKLDNEGIANLAGKLNGLKLADEIKAVWSAEVGRLTGEGKLAAGDVKALAPCGALDWPSPWCIILAIGISVPLVGDKVGKGEDYSDEISSSVSASLPSPTTAASTTAASTTSPTTSSNPEATSVPGCERDKHTANVDWVGIRNGGGWDFELAAAGSALRCCAYCYKTTRGCNAWLYVPSKGAAPDCTLIAGYKGGNGADDECPGGRPGVVFNVVDDKPENVAGGGPCAEDMVML